MNANEIFLKPSAGADIPHESAHLQVQGLLRVSRTVQWWREAAQRETLHLCRIAEESLLTGAYLRTFVHWLRHPTEDEADLRALLRRQLRCSPLILLLRR